MTVRNSLEGFLSNQGFDYFHGGIVSKKSIYEENTDYLGDHFIDNCVEFKLNGRDLGIIISPESTFRVYDYLTRTNKIENQSGKVFYSQEFLRNESLEDIEKGKTFSFWQTGFEIYGKEEIESSVLALKTLIGCFAAIHMDLAYFRVSDKRILEGILTDLSLKQRREIYRLIDRCEEDGDRFEACFIKQGGNKEVARKVAMLLDMGKTEKVTLKRLDEFTDNELSHIGIQFLQTILDKLEKEKLGAKIEIIPFMPKSWEACDNLLFDARIPNYPYAVAGGGNLFAFNKENKIIKSGAGIGVTRIIEYIIQNEKIEMVE